MVTINTVTRVAASWPDGYAHSAMPLCAIRASSTSAKIHCGRPPPASVAVKLQRAIPLPPRWNMMSFLLISRALTLSRMFMMSEMRSSHLPALLPMSR